MEHTNIRQGQRPGRLRAQAAFAIDAFVTHVGPNLPDLRPLDVDVYVSQAFRLG